MSADKPAVETTRRELRRQSRRGGVYGVLGEILITAGVLVMLFLGWQLWLNDIIVGGQQTEAAGELTETWEQEEPGDRQEGVSAGRPVDPGEPAVASEPSNAERFGVLIVPRFGADYERPIAQGVGLADVLNPIGIGHYPGTQMPGEVGNFAVAAHRTTWGAPFQDVHTLQVGDRLYVETKAGWYSYIFRTLEYVLPTGVGVLEPVPQVAGADAGERYITLTTCNPKFSQAERLIAYGVFDTWYPRKGGPPSEIAETVSARGK